jgi:hypothetical protein
VAQPLGSLESGRPSTTFTTLSNRGLTYELPFYDSLHSWPLRLPSHFNIHTVGGFFVYGVDKRV